MAPVVVFAGTPAQRETYRRHLTEAAAAEGLEIRLHMDPDEVAPETVDYLIFAANGPVRDFAPYTGLRAILNLWAGVEGVLALDPPRAVPLVRMVEEGLTLGMIDYVVGHTLRHHLDIDRYIDARPIAEWEVDFPPLARERSVAVLGLGVLGRTVAEALAAHGFQVHGWSRTPKSVADIACHHGADGLDAALGAAEILVLLLPLTEATRRLIDAERLARLPEGACLINAGRGPLIDHEALLVALDRGRIRHATMDVFDVEPLPPEHRYWTHPRVTVTPHIASVTRPATASVSLIRRIAEDQRGEALQNVVDRARGY